MLVLVLMSMLGVVFWLKFLMEAFLIFLVLLVLLLALLLVLLVLVLLV